MIQSLTIGLITQKLGTKENNMKKTSLVTMAEVLGSSAAVRNGLNTVFSCLPTCPAFFTMLGKREAPFLHVH